MKQHTRSTTDFNKVKGIDDVWKKAAEQEEMMRPPPAIVEEALKRKHTYQHH